MGCPSRLLRRSLTFIACFIVFAAVAEGYLRYKGYVPSQDAQTIKRSGEPEFDPELGWAAYVGEELSCGEPTPGTILAKIREDGQRDHRPLLLKDGKMRVLVLGCSVAFGYGIEAWETFVWQLNERFPDVVFDNYAFPGYGTLQCKIKEKRLLEQNKYDLVLYAPFHDHVLRNVFGIVFTSDFDNSSVAIQYVIKHNYQIWFLPTADINKRHEIIEHYPYYETSGWARHSAVLNTLYRYAQYRYNIACLDYYIEHQHLACGQEIYWRLLAQMNDIAKDHGSDFAVMCLEDEGDPKNLLQFPNASELAVMNQNSNAPLSFPPSYTYKFLGNGRHGKPDAPKFHAGNTLEGHPSATIHQEWAESIGDWFQEWRAKRNS